VKIRIPVGESFVLLLAKVVKSCQKKKKIVSILEIKKIKVVNKNMHSIDVFVAIATSMGEPEEDSDGTDDSGDTI
jgi:hypothetical protein